MIGRKYSTVRASPQGFSDGGILPGYFITPSHNLTQNHHDCLHFVIPCCRPAKNHKCSSQLMENNKSSQNLVIEYNIHYIVYKINL